MLGRTLLILSSSVSAWGSFYADFNETHVYNPRWPPHAKFHNGQTMSMSVVLFAGCAYYALRPTGPDPTAALDSLSTAAVFASIYYATGLSAILYPGSKGTDPEFGEGFKQLWGFSGLWALGMVGWWLERRSIIGRGKGSGRK